MSGFDVINNLVTIMQKFENLEAMRNGTTPSTITAQTVLQLVNEQPEKAQLFVDAAKRLPEEFGMTAAEAQDFDVDSIKQLFDDWRFLPSDYNLQLQDYNAIADYFLAKRPLSSLKDSQRDLIYALEFKADDFSVDSGLFDFDHDAVNMYNLREQLLGRLERDDILNPGLIDLFKNDFPETFSFMEMIKPPEPINFNEVPGISSAPKAQVPKVQKPKTYRSQKILQKLLTRNPNPSEDEIRDFAEQHNLSEEDTADFIELVERHLMEQKLNELQGDLDRMAKMNELKQQIAEREQDGPVEEKQRFVDDDIYDGDSDIERPDEQQGGQDEQRGGQDDINPGEIELADMRTPEQRLRDLGKAKGEYVMRADVYKPENEGLTAKELVVKMQGWDKPDSKYYGKTFDEIIEQKRIDTFDPEKGTSSGRNADSYFIKEYNDELERKKNGATEPEWNLDASDKPALDFLQEPGQPGIRSAEEDLRNPFKKLSDAEKKQFLDKAFEADDAKVKEALRVDNEGNLFFNVSDLKAIAKFIGTQGAWIIGGMAATEFANLIGQIPGQIVSMGLNIYGLAVGHDPTGMAMFAIQKLLEENQLQDQRKLESEHPEDFRGKFYGKVLIETPEGEKWVPAMTAAINKDPVLFNREDQMTLAYSPSGSPVLYRYMGTGDLVPYFEDEQLITFNINDDEVFYGDRVGWNEDTGKHVRRTKYSLGANTFHDTRSVEYLCKHTH